MAWLLDGERVVRVPRHGRAADALAREACLLRRIASELPVPVPETELVGSPDENDPPVSIHVRIPGVELTRERWLGLGADARRRLARELGSVLGALHGLDPGIAAPCDLQRLDHRAELEDLQERLRDGDAAFPDALRKDLARVFGAALDGNRPWSFRPALLHADVSPGHVLMDPDREEITGVIDWGDACVGDPARDFIFLYEDWGSDFLELTLEGYELEEAERMLPRVHLRYLADQLSWTLGAVERGRAKDVRHGVAELTSALDDLRRTRAREELP